MLKPNANRVNLEKSHILSPDNFVLIRMWPPKYKDNTVAYPTAFLKHFLHKPGVNVGHVSLSIFVDGKEVYISHWPGEPPSRKFAAVTGVNNTLLSDLADEGCNPSSYVIIYGLNNQKMCVQFQQIGEEAPWFMFGNKKRLDSNANAYSCSSYVYEILSAGGIFNRLLNKYDQKKEPISPIDVANLAKKAANKELELNPELTNLIAATMKNIKKELLVKSTQSNGSFEELLKLTDYLSLYQAHSQSDFPELLSTVTNNIGKAIEKNKTQNSKALLETVKALIDVNNKMNPEENTKAKMINNSILPRFDRLIENNNIGLDEFDENGKNALYIVIAKRNYYCLEKLLRKFPDAINSLICMPINNTFEKEGTGKTQVPMFLSNNAKPGIYQTPLDLAIQLNDEKLISFIKENVASNSEIGTLSRNNCN